MTSMQAIGSSDRLAVSSGVSHDEREVLEGLASKPKRLPCRLLYDEVGSQLFEQICETPEYYPTRTEVSILQRHARELLGELAGLNDVAVVEWGSGAALKTRLLLDALEAPRLYVPVDISPEILLQAANRLESQVEGLEVRPVIADYLQELTLPLSREERARPIVTFFPGSTLGNLEPEQAVQFLEKIRRIGGPHQRFILGTDLPKDPILLEAAYDDAAGITARFNLNVLRVVSERFRGNFDVASFRHRAVYNRECGRMEMHLVSTTRQTVTILGERFDFTEGEALVTEHCYKYSVPELRSILQRAGFQLVTTCMDDERLFAVHACVPAVDAV